MNKLSISKIKNLLTKESMGVALIVLISAFLRLYKIRDYMTFLGDEGRDVLVVYNILHGHLTLLGPTASVGGFFLGPIYYYFMAPFLWLFNYDPVGPAVMVALFGIATVWLVYKLGREFFNNKVGVVAALIYAISPLVITYSRSSWNPNPLPFFAILIVYFLYKAVDKNNVKLFFLVGFLLGIAIQLHYLATFLGVIIGVYVLVTRLFFKENLLNSIKRTLRDYMYLFLGFVVGWSPFLAFEVRHGFPDFKSLISFILYSGDTGGNSNFFSITYDVFFRIFGRLVGDFPSPEQYYWYAKPFLTAWYIFILILGILSVLLLVYQVKKVIKNKNKDFNKYFLFLIWFLFGILLFGFYKKPIYDYYFAFMFPLPFILVGNLIVFLYGETGKFLRVTKYLGLLVLLVVVLLNLKGYPFQYQPNRQLNQMKTISAFVVSKTGEKPFNFALITGGNSDYAYRYFFTLWGRSPVTIQNAQVDPQRKTVTNQLMVVCESLPCQPLGNSLWEIAGFGRAQIVGHWNVSVVEVYKLVHYK
ncbi:MAG: glycosyltransferase family 39 protein [Patescibacteria group bacterium]|nr:glycosyltransferase family 39 protein [Patescibacteria group bacterium]